MNRGEHEGSSTAVGLIVAVRLEEDTGDHYHLFYKSHQSLND